MGSGLKRRATFDTVSLRAEGGHMKSIFVIADGLGGRPTDLNGKTCLEAAQKPHLDRLAARGAVGLVDPIGPGIRPGSDTAHLSLLGYNPRELYTGRGVFECLGIGLDVRPGDICFRANFATVEEAGGALRLVDRRAGRIESGQRELEEAIDGMKLKTPGVEVLFRASTEHRGALLLRGQDLSPYVGETDPHETGAELRASEPMADGKAARRTADAVNELTRRSYDLLGDLPLNRQRAAAGKMPANILLVRGAADCPHIPSISSIYGVRGAVIAGGALYRGVALACGLEPIDVRGATGGLDTDLRAKAKAALAALAEYDLVFVHIKGTDNAAHDHDAAAKMWFIQQIDERFFGTLLEGIDWQTTHIAFTGDHTTAVDYGDHTADPVPVLLAGPNVRSDDVTTFDERSAARGGLSRFSGQVLPMLMSCADRCPKFGS
jgi:2,3-bisphosphoglycerate-independent phosphoglycerate mutase